MVRLFLFITATVLSIAFTPVVTQADNFQSWLTDLRGEAHQRGVSDVIFDAALGDAKPIKRVIELDRSQPEFTLTFDEYLNKIVSKTRAQKAAQKLIEHDEILTKISKKYGVQKRFIVTFWGVETNFGQYLGSFSVPHALATLAFDGRRSAYFRKELLNALQILQEGHITPSQMKGSCGRAMGQLCPQAFCPMLLIGTVMENAISGVQNQMFLPQPLIISKSADGMTS